MTPEEQADHTLPSDKWAFDASVTDVFYDMLEKAGFRQVDSFWRWCNFAGWIAIR